MQLLIEAGLLSTWDLNFWFRDCWLKGGTICVPTEELASSIRRCYLPQIQTVLKECDVRVVTPEQTRAKSVYKGQLPTKGSLWE